MVVYTRVVCVVFTDVTLCDLFVGATAVCCATAVV